MSLPYVSEWEGPLRISDIYSQTELGISTCFVPNQHSEIHAEELIHLGKELVRPYLLSKAKGGWCCWGCSRGGVRVGLSCWILNCSQSFV